MASARAPPDRVYYRSFWHCFQLFQYLLNVKTSADEKLLPSPEKPIVLDRFKIVNKPSLLFLLEFQMFFFCLDSFRSKKSIRFQEPPVTTSASKYRLLVTATEPSGLLGNIDKFYVCINRIFYVKFKKSLGFTIIGVCLRRGRKNITRTIQT